MKDYQDLLDSVPDLIQHISWEKGQHKIHHQRHHQRQPFPIQVVTASLTLNIYFYVFCFYGFLGVLLSTVFLFLYLKIRTITTHRI